MQRPAHPGPPAPALSGEAVLAAGPVPQREPPPSLDSGRSAPCRARGCLQRAGGGRRPSVGIGSVSARDDFRGQGRHPGGAGFSRAESSLGRSGKEEARATPCRPPGKPRKRARPVDDSEPRRQPGAGTAGRRGERSVRTATSPGRALQRPGCAREGSGSSNRCSAKPLPQRGTRPPESRAGKAQ